MNLDDLNEKMQVFLEGKTKIHIDLTDGTFLNGFVIKNIKEGVWWMKEDKLGFIFVFIKEISKLQQNREVGEDVG